MDSRAKCVLGAVIYVAVLFVVMFAWNRIFPNGFSADEMIASLTAAFIAYISGFRSAATDKKSK